MNLRKGKTSKISPDGFPVRNSLVILCRRSLNSGSFWESRVPPKTDHNIFIAGRRKYPFFCFKEEQCFTYQQKETRSSERARELESQIIISLNLIWLSHKIIL
jgi:hypothetical protein